MTESMRPRRGMKAKTIKTVLRKKFNAFAASIEDEHVRALVQKNTIITGGCIASMLLGERVNDFDLYFANHATTKAVAEYYIKKFKDRNQAGIACGIYLDNRDDDRVKIVVQSAGIATTDGAEQPYEYFEGQEDEVGASYVSELMDDTGDIQDTYEKTEDLALAEADGSYRPVFLSSNAITLSDKVQLVLRFHGDAESIHENYDFIHCTNYWKSADNELVLREKAMEALLARELRYVGSLYPVCSVMRLRKFLARGWVVNAGQILKMLMQVSELDLTNPVVLEDQLTGVDSAYFIQIIDRVRAKDPDKVNSAYLVEIIDRMF